MDVARNRGPWTYRLLVWGFTVALGVLCLWSTGFVLDDIGNWPGPDRDELEQAQLDPQLTAEAKSLSSRIDESRRDTERDTKQQDVLQSSTQAAQRTMSQLLDFQRLAIEKGVNPSPEEQKALADSQQIFLDNQRQYQQLNEQIARAQSQRSELENEQRALDERLAAARRPINEEFDRLWEQHRWRIAALKLAVILPLLAVAVFSFFKWRSTIYAPLIFAFGAATILQVGRVLYDYFPDRYFKYIVIGISLIVVVRILVYLVRMVAYPKSDWLLGQYREAYERFLCPVCEYPIRRGPLKYLYWTRRTASKLPQLTTMSDGDQPYVCPMCATRLFEECSACHAQRHTLLPACEHCGATRSAVEITALARPAQQV